MYQCFFYWTFLRHLTIGCYVQNLATNMDKRLVLSTLSDHIWVRECSACGWMEVHLSTYQLEPEWSKVHYLNLCQPNIILQLPSVRRRCATLYQLSSCWLPRLHSPIRTKNSIHLWTIANQLSISSSITCVSSQSEYVLYVLNEPKTSSYWRYCFTLILRHNHLRLRSELPRVLF
jgi:hypothetical protein